MLFRALSQFYFVCSSSRPSRRLLSSATAAASPSPASAQQQRTRDAPPAGKRKPYLPFPRRPSRPIPPPPRASKPLNDELERIVRMNPKMRQRGEAVTQLVQRVLDQPDAKPDTRSLHLLLQLCAQYMTSKKVEEVFHSLQKQHSLNKTSVVYLCFIEAVAREKNTKAIFDLLADMREANSKLEDYNFFHIMQLLNKQSFSYDAATKIFSRIHYLWNPIEPDKFVLEEMMRLCRRTAHPDALASYFQRYCMKITPQTPPKKICDLLLSAFQAAGRAEEAAVILDPLRHASKAIAHPEKYNKYAAS